MSIGSFPGDRRSDSIWQALDHLRTFGGLQGISETHFNITTTPVKLTGWDTIMSTAVNTTPDISDESITVDNGGKYEVFCQIACTTVASEELTFAIYVNGAALAIPMETKREIGTGGDIGSCSILGVIDLVAEDVVTIYVAAADADADLTVLNAQFWIKGML